MMAPANIQQPTVRAGGESTSSNSGATLGQTGEFSLINQITAGLEQGPAVQVGPGDDGAVVALNGSLVCSIDTLVEGVHFRRDWSLAHEVGSKAVAASVADLEAMGATPVALTASLSAPKDLPASWARQCSAGMAAEAVKAKISIVGGDVTGSRDVTIAVSVIGQLEGRTPVRRSGARAGQVVAMIGRVGWAAAGLAVLGRGFRSPRVMVQAQKVPEVPYGQGKVAAVAGATSMIDISDGLLADLGHVADASAVGIDLHADAFEVPEPMRAVAAATGKDPMSFILAGGEDHALVATFVADKVPQGWTVIGSVVDGAGEVLLDGAGTGDLFESGSGWDHFG